MRRAVLLALAVSLAASACGRAAEAPGTPAGVPVVVATTPVLADLAEMVVGQGAQIRSLVPPGADPHQYRFTEFDLEVTDDAVLVVTNGSGLEPDLTDLRKRVDAERLFVATVQLDEPVVTPGGEPDPHFWHDPLEAAAVVEALAGRLADLDPDEAGAYLARGRSARAEMQGLARAMAGVLESVPERRRALVTQHDFFRYFARRFDLSILGSVVAGTSSLDQPSGSGRAALVEAMNERDACAVFTSASTGEALSAVVAEEVDHDVDVVEVFGDTLGGEVLDYRDMMRENARRVTSALTECG